MSVSTPFTFVFRFCDENQLVRWRVPSGIILTGAPFKTWPQTDEDTGETVWNLSITVYIRSHAAGAAFLSWVTAEEQFAYALFPDPRLEGQEIRLDREDLNLARDIFRTQAIRTGMVFVCYPDREALSVRYAEPAELPTDTLPTYIIFTREGDEEEEEEDGDAHGSARHNRTHRLEPIGPRRPESIQKAVLFVLSI